MREFDVVVVGGGSAGCVLAARLSENPDCSVCLVEAGPDYGPFADGHWPADILDARNLALSHSWAQEPEEDRSQLRARILGGCSAHNACAVLRGAPADYEWGHGWSHDRLARHLERAETTLRKRRFDRDELAPSHRALIEAAQAVGLPVLEDPDDPRPGVFSFPVNSLGGVRWNTAFAYLDPARTRPNLTILPGTLADRVDPGAAVLVTDRGDLKAGRIVLAAGAYGSPAVLLRSGIGPGLAHDLPVGEGLVDHSGVGLGWEPSELLHEVTARHAEQQALVMGQAIVKARSSCCSDDAFDLHLFGAINAGEAPGRFELSAAIFLVDPRSTGRVRLRSADPEAPLVVEHGFLSDPGDVRPLCEGIELMREIAAAAPFGALVERESRPGKEADLEAYVRGEVRGYFHPVATCALGRVVDGSCRVPGCEGLYVADASIVPRIPRANTNLTVVALAEAAAESLSGARTG